MQLGRELATGFVHDDAPATTGEQEGLPPEAADMRAADAASPPSPDPEPAVTG